MFQAQHHEGVGMRKVCSTLQGSARDGAGAYGRFEQGYADDESWKSTAVTIPSPFG